MPEAVPPLDPVGLADLLSSSERTLRCPHLARPAGPVEHVAAAGTYVVSSAELIQSVLSRPEEFSSQNTEAPEALVIWRTVLARIAERPEMADLVERGYGTIDSLRVLLYADPPEHTRHRRLVTKTFSARRVRELEPLIRGNVDRLLAPVLDRGEGDLMRDLAIPLPLIVIAGLIGVDVKEWPLFRKWSDTFLLATGNLNPSESDYEAMVAMKLEFDRYIMDVVGQRRAQRGDDLIQDLIDFNENANDPLSIDEFLWIMKIVLTGGNETTAKQLGNALMVLVERPKWQERLRAEPSAIPAFAEESLRLEPSVQGTFRLALRDTTIGDAAVPKGSVILLNFNNSNRDGGVFPDPDEIRLDRGKAGANHLAFGRGIHYCPGANLARAETVIAIERLLKHTRDIRFAPGVNSRDDVAYFPSFMLHGPLTLPVIADVR